MTSPVDISHQLRVAVQVEQGGPSAANRRARQVLQPVPTCPRRRVMVLHLAPPDAIRADVLAGVRGSAPNVVRAL